MVDSVGVMELSFRSRALQERCNSADQLTSKYGHLVAAALKRRLAQLAAAPSLLDAHSLAWLNLMALDGYAVRRYTVDVTPAAHIICQPCDDPIPLDDDGEIVISLVTALLILGIEVKP